MSSIRHTRRSPRPHRACSTKTLGGGLFNGHSGLLIASSDTGSAVSLQLLQVLGPLTGSGTASVRTFGVLVALAALAAVYWLGNRVAGRLCGVVAALVILACDLFRAGAVEGLDLPALVLVGALFVGAMHAALGGPRRTQTVLLGLAGALAVVGNVLLLPGVVAVILMLSLAGGARSRKLITATALLTLVVALLPNRFSTADRHAGDALGDLSRVSTLARNAEFGDSTDAHGAPAPAVLAADPAAGPSVGLVGYVVGDHSPGVLVGGTLAGLRTVVNMVAKRSQSGFFGLLALVMAACGTVYLLLLRRLRLLVLLPLVWLAVPLFFTGQGHVAALTAPVAALALPVLGLAAGVFAYLVTRLASRHQPEPIDDVRGA